jgi:ATP-binding protein involved in chromosome partitioning
MFGKTNTTLTERAVLDALKGVKDPDLGRDLVDLGMIKDIRIGDGSISLTVNLTTPACPMKAQIERDVRTALQGRLPGEWTFNIAMTAEVRGKGIAETGDIPGIKNVIAVGSGKGGVGKSTMAAAIAFGLKSYGTSVGLMDADVYGPSIPHLVGATGRPMARGERIQPIETGGLKLMSMGFLLEPEKAVIMRGPMLHGIMQQFLRQVDWGPLDYLVIDLPPGTGDVPLTLAQSLPLTGAVVVCTPQEVALLDATRAITMFRQLKVPVLGMIENMSFFDVVAYLRERGGPEAHRLIDAKSFFDSPGDERVYLFGHGGARRRAEQLGVPFLGEVPLNIFLREAGDAGKMEQVLLAGSPARPYLLNVVEQLAAQISIRNIQAPKMPKLEVIG